MCGTKGGGLTMPGRQMEALLVPQLMRGHKQRLMRLCSRINLLVLWSEYEHFMEAKLARFGIYYRGNLIHLKTVRHENDISKSLGRRYTGKAHKAFRQARENQNPVMHGDIICLIPTLEFEHLCSRIMLFPKK